MNSVYGVGSLSQMSNVDGAWCRESEINAECSAVPGVPGVPGVAADGFKNPDCRIAADRDPVFQLLHVLTYVVT